MTVLELRDVTIARSGAPILRNVSWRTEEGEHWVVLGPNGAGKTTLVRALTGREYCDSGEVLVLDRPLADYDPHTLGTVVGLSSSSVASHVRAGQTALDIVRTAAWGQAVSFDEEYEDVDVERAHAILAAFGVGHLADRRFSTLSEGEKQRVLLGRALMSDPEVVIFDEPSAGLDLGAREILLRAMTEIMGGRRAPQLIVITHHLEEIPAGITHALLLKDGRVNAAGPINDVLTGIELSELFDLPLNVTQDNGRWFAHAVK